jgi:hypothetical protein
VVGFGTVILPSFDLCLVLLVIGIH